jgi:hypothetical protein
MQATIEEIRQRLLEQLDVPDGIRAGFAINLATLLTPGTDFETGDYDLTMIIRNKSNRLLQESNALRTPRSVSSAAVDFGVRQEL